MVLFCLIQARLKVKHGIFPHQAHYCSRSASAPPAGGAGHAVGERRKPADPECDRVRFHRGIHRGDGEVSGRAG